MGIINYICSTFLIISSK